MSPGEESADATASATCCSSGAGEEDQDVAGLFIDNGFGRGGDLRFQWSGGIRSVGDCDFEEPAFGRDRGAIIEEAADGRRVERGGHDDDAKVGTRGLLEAAEEREGEVGFEVALVEFVENNGGDAAEGWVGDEAAGENAFGEETQARFRTGDLFEANLVADGFAGLFAHFESHAARGHAGGDAAGLEDENLAGQLEKGSRDACGFACAGGGFKDEAGVVMEGFEDFGDKSVYREIHHNFSLTQANKRRILDPCCSATTLPCRTRRA